MSERTWAAAIGLTLLLASPLPAQVEVHPVLGGLPADSGLAAGVELVRYRTLGPLDARLRLVGSAKLYEYAEFALEAPPPATHDFFMAIRARYRNYPEEDFWGLGPDTGEEGRSAYRLEDAGLSGAFGLHTRTGLRVAATLGFVAVNIGPGDDDDFPSIESRHAPAAVPALGRQPDFWHYGVELDFDRRDSRSDPRSGQKVGFRWSRFQARQEAPYDFGRYDIELQQFVPVADRHRVAARVALFLTDPDTGSEVPFFMQPTAGGTDTIRGLRQYRFRDRNAIVMNLEYRHALYGFLDGVAFVDAGRVFARPSDLTLADLETAGGFGLRTKLGGRVFFGVDVGWSNEGARLWFRSGHMF